MIYHPKYTVISILLTVFAVGNFSFAGEMPQSARPAEEVVKTGPNPLFKINSSNIVEDDSIFKFCIFTDSLQRNDLLRRFEICGYSSPDGPEAFNAKLAIDRANAIRSLIQNKYEIPDFLFQISSVDEDWEKTRQLVQASSMHGKRDVLTIIDNTADKTVREKRLRTLNGGSTWRALVRDIFPHVRRAEMVIRYNGGELHTTLSDQGTEIKKPICPQTEPEMISGPQPDTLPEPESETVSNPTPAIDPCRLPQWHIGTNAAEWALAITNLTGEYDFARSWSAALSLHYSAWDYGTTTRKFRTFIFRPEVRYWLRDCHKGLFVSVHAEMAAYNFALPGWHYRIQDVNGKHPAIGGGLGIGYRVDLDKKRRWSFQADLGAGAYYLKYDRYENRHNGPLVDTKSRVWAGIDHFGLSIIYNFKPRKR